MTWPGLPTSRSGAYVIEPTVDEACQANLVTRLGKPFGVWLDDTTPNLEHWIELATAKYAKVFVCVPPGEPNHHYPAPIISVYEAYIYGMGVRPEAWLPLPKFNAYCVQHSWPGTHGAQAPTSSQFQTLLQLVLNNHPSFVFLF